MSPMCLDKGPCISRIFIMINNFSDLEKARTDNSWPAGTGAAVTDLSCHHLVEIHLCENTFCFITYFFLLTVHSMPIKISSYHQF